MTKRLKRTSQYELSLHVSDDQFISPPRDSQRNWLLNRVMREFADELSHLDSISKTFVRGAEGVSTLQDRTQRELVDDEIMEDWQIPLMKAMAGIVTESGGDVLEIGFGRGVSAEYVQSADVKSHTVIECNDNIVARFHDWRSKYSDRDIRMAHGRWQDVIGDLGEFDAILFHTYPLNEEEFVQQVARGCTFAEHFFETASSHLRSGGVFTYLTNEPDSLSREHQRSLLRRFSSYSVSIIRDLEIPDDTHDAAWADSMAIIRVVK